MERIAALDDYKGIGYHQLLANSFLISADAGHAVSISSFSRSSIDDGGTRGLVVGFGGDEEKGTKRREELMIGTSELRG